MQKEKANTSRNPKKGKKKNGGSKFPGRLHDMLEYAESQNMESIISWVLNGRGFIIHNPEKLVEILPLFFSQTQYRSFRRQLCMWHFERIHNGPNKGAFLHPYFVKSDRSLCAHMSRQIFCQKDSATTAKRVSDNTSKDSKKQSDKEPKMITSTSAPAPRALSDHAVSQVSLFDDTLFQAQPYAYQSMGNASTTNRSNGEEGSKSDASKQQRQSLPHSMDLMEDIAPLIGNASFFDTDDIFENIVDGSTMTANKALPGNMFIPNPTPIDESILGPTPLPNQPIHVKTQQGTEQFENNQLLFGLGNRMTPNPCFSGDDAATSVNGQTENKLNDTIFPFPRETIQSRLLRNANINQSLLNSTSNQIALSFASIFPDSDNFSF